MSVTTELSWDDFFTTPHPDEAHDDSDAKATIAESGVTAEIR